MAKNLIQKIFGGGNSSGIESSGSGGGGKIVVPGSSDLSGINVGDLLSSGDKEADPTQIKKLPRLNIPVIPGIKPVTDKELVDTKNAAEVFNKQIDNFKEYIAIAGGMKVKAAEGTVAYQKYMEKVRKANEMETKANKDNIIDAAQYGLAVQNHALEAERVIKETSYHIQQLSTTYEKIGGW